MKSALLLFALISSLYTARSQTTFEFRDYPSTVSSSFADARLFDGQYFFLSTHVDHTGAQDMTSALWIMDEHGHLLETRPLGSLNQQYFKIIDKQGPVLRLAGAMQHDTCLAIAVIAAYNLESGELIHLDELPLCNSDRVIKRITLVTGHNQETFIQVMSGIRTDADWGQKTTLLKIDDTGQLEVIIDKYRFPTAQLTYDFRETGYVIMETWLIEFFTSDFIFRKDRFNAQSRYEPADYSYSQPFAQSMMMDMANLNDEPGCAIRLIDSHFHVQRELIIPTATGVTHQNYFPLYGGIHVLNDSTAWLVSNFGGTQSQHDTYFSVAKVDDELNILCQEYIGFVSRYQIEGLLPTPDGGLLVYGYTEPSGAGYNNVIHNVYARKINADCESITATHDPSADIALVPAFPNPSNNIIQFDLTGFDAATLRCEFIDATGKVVHVASDLQTALDVTGLPKGHYFYRILEKDRFIGSGSWVKQ